jgi:hypothetical protein
MRRDPLRRDDDFDREFRSVSRLAKGWFLVCAVLSVAVVGVLIWAAIRLVERFT